MTIAERFPDENIDTREAIMLATYEALCEHGYAALTIERIDNEFPKSKSLLYHHYDSKDDLLLDFLEYLLSVLPPDLAPDDVGGPNDRLESIIDYILTVEPGRADDDFLGALVELRAQAVNDPDYREHFTRSDVDFHARIENVLQDGVESGDFQDHDTDAAATFLNTLLHGALQRRVTSDEPRLDVVRDQLERYLNDVVYAEA